MLVGRPRPAPDLLLPVWAALRLTPGAAATWRQVAVYASLGKSLASASKQVGRASSWSLHWGLSPGPSVYRTDALPLSYRGIYRTCCCCKIKNYRMPVHGVCLLRRCRAQPRQQQAAARAARDAAVRSRAAPVARQLPHRSTAHPIATAACSWRGPHCACKQADQPPLGIEPRTFSLQD